MAGLCTLDHWLLVAGIQAASHPPPYLDLFLFLNVKTRVVGRAIV